MKKYENSDEGTGKKDGYLSPIDLANQNNDIISSGENNLPVKWLCKEEINDELREIGKDGSLLVNNLTTRQSDGLDI